MARIRGLILFYRSFFLYPGLVLTAAGCYLYHRNAKYKLDVGPSVFALKAIVFAMTAYVVYSRKELYFYYNLRLTYFSLLLSALLLDCFIFFTCLKMTPYLF